MLEFLIEAVVGVVLLMVGISNYKGNINSIHSYHRNRLKEEDKAIFGKLMGIGSMICALGIIVAGLLSLIASLIDKQVLITVGSCVVGVSLFMGIGIMIYTTIKYNKGLF